MSDQPTPPDDNQLIAERRDKLKGLRTAQSEGRGVAFPNDFVPTHKALALHTGHDAREAENREALANPRASLVFPWVEPHLPISQVTVPSK